MSLDDKFYPDDKNPLTKIDNLLIKTARKGAEFYQNLTGKDYTTLRTGLAYVGIMSGIASIYGGNFIIGPMMSLNNHFYKNTKSTPLEDQIKSEIITGWKYFKTTIRVGATALIPVVGYLTGELKTAQEQLSNIFFCISATTMMANQYLGLIEPPKVPDKSYGKKIKEKIKEWLSPEPQPRLLPIRNNYSQ